MVWPSGGVYHIGFKTVRASHLPHARVELTVHFTRQQFARLEKHMQLREEFNFGGGHTAYLVFCLQL